jgi:hypothetical protein
MLVRPFLPEFDDHVQCRHTKVKGDQNFVRVSLIRLRKASSLQMPHLRDMT